jgi:hypothetical protein
MARDDELLRALADADPAKLDPPPALGSERYQAILEAAMSKESTPEIHEFPSVNPSMNQPRRRTRPVLRLALIAAVAVIALAAVSIAVLRPGHEPSASAAVQAAAEKTGSADSLRVTLSIEYADGSSSTTQGEMKGLDVRIATDHTAADGSVWQERIVVVGDQMWEGSSAPVTIGSDERLTLFSEACEAVLDAALQAQEVETVGTEDIRGSEATHYRIALDEASRAALEKLSPSHLAWFELEYPSEVTSIDVWVTDGLVHRMVVDGELGTATADYHDFNADITITPPAGS